MVSFSRRVLLLPLLFALTGCSSNMTVTVTPIHSQQKFLVNFNRAYFSRDQAGEDRIVLVSDPIDGSDAKHPTTTPPLWQVLFIRLHWRKATYSGLDSPVSSNAVLHWYIYTQPGDPGSGALHYVGTGSVGVSPDSTGASISIGNAQVSLLDQHGNLHDPFETFLIRSNFYAESNPVKLQQTLDDAEKAAAK